MNGLNIIRKKIEFHEIRNMEIFFDNITEKLIEVINKSDYAVGCIAWVTNIEIINALSHLKGVKIVVNKEEYLREDSPFAIRLREAYSSCKDIRTSGISSYNFKEDTSTLNQAFITCGIADSEIRMHHKFLVLFKETIPWAVWTGSFNFTDNAKFSLENAILIKDLEVAEKYLEEFKTIIRHGQDLKWKKTSLNLDEFS
jgi:phosphatidylserine/phosphatidylglycerophosphate/cardiolipin synthase-like enzyme